MMGKKVFTICVYLNLCEVLSMFLAIRLICIVFDDIRPCVACKKSYKTGQLTRVRYLSHMRILKAILKCLAWVPTFCVLAAKALS